LEELVVFRHLATLKAFGELVASRNWFGELIASRNWSGELVELKLVGRID
jgi:hypothetical protein